MPISDSVGYFSAFLAGFLSFISPCVLPLVPVYLTTMTGLSLEELGAESGRPTARIFQSGTAFCLGLSVVFIALGLSATAIGSFLIENLRAFEIVAGVAIVIFGLHMTGILKLKFLYRSFQVPTKGVEKTRRDGGWNRLGKPFLMGGAFAFGWTPCVGPILAAVLALAATRESMAKGGMLLAVYSLGLALPFLISGLAFSKFMMSYKRLRIHLHTVEIVSGCLLILFGLLIGTHRFAMLTGWISRFLPTPSL